MKRCCTCHELKPLTDYNKRAKAVDGLQSRCRDCSRRWYEANKTEHKRTTRKHGDAVRRKNCEEMGRYLQEHPCVDCGESDIRVLDFDHRPGEQKVANVTRLVASSYPWRFIEREIAKCDVRCANCHRVVTCERANNWRQRAFTTLP